MQHTCFLARWSLAVVLACCLAGCAGLSAYHDPPRVSLVSIRPLSMTVLEQRYVLQLRMLNPNAVALPITGMDYRIEINHQEFAYGVSHQSVQIPAQGEAELEVTVTSSLLDLLRQLQDSGNGHGIEYRVSGTVSLKGSTRRLPFEYSGTLGWVPGSGSKPG